MVKRQKSDKVWGVNRYRKFGGKSFILTRRETTKPEVDEFTDHLKKRGRKYRVVKKGRWYFIYAR